MTDPYRAMCAELLEALEIQLDELRFNNRLCIRASALLDQPEPPELTDEKLLSLVAEVFGYVFLDGGIGGGESEFLAYARAAIAADRARALLDQPVEEKPPADGEVAELQRWGVDHGAQPGRPLLSPMEDGYWTPWHIAADLLQRLASDNAGLEAAAESLYWSNLSLLDSQND
jgi:hypothetical protein